MRQYVYAGYRTNGTTTSGRQQPGMGASKGRCERTGEKWGAAERDLVDGSEMSINKRLERVV